MGNGTGKKSKKKKKKKKKKSNKKKKKKKKKNSFSRLFPPTGAGPVAGGFVGKISAPELLPSQLYVLFFAVLERYSG